MNGIEPPKQMKREKGVDKAIEEFMNGLEPPKQTRREKDVDDGVQELLDALGKTLKEN